METGALRSATPDSAMRLMLSQAFMVWISSSRRYTTRPTISW